MELEIECPDGYNFALTAMPGDQIQSVKEQIKKEASEHLTASLSPSGILEISYAGELLQDDRKLRDYSIGIGAILYVEHWTKRPQDTET